MIDKKLLAAHQWVVDASERKPGWWAENVAYPITGLHVAPILLRLDSGWDGVAVLLLLALGACLISAARSESFLATLGADQSIRVIVLLLIAWDAFRLFVEPSGDRFARLIAGVIMMSYYYFAACKPPRPKNRKQRLVPQAG